MGQAVAVDAFWLLVAFGACGALWYLGYRLEPHYASKDGRRFLCTGRWMTARGEPEGRKREVRIIVLGDGRLQMEVKRGLRRKASFWSLEGKASEASRKKAVYVLRANAVGGTQRMTIQLPSKSRSVPVLDQALARTR